MCIENNKNGIDVNLAQRYSAHLGLFIRTGTLILICISISLCCSCQKKSEERTSQKGLTTSKQGSPESNTKDHLLWRAEFIEAKKLLSEIDVIGGLERGYSDEEKKRITRAEKLVKESPSPQYYYLHQCFGGEVDYLLGIIAFCKKWGGGTIRYLSKVLKFRPSDTLYKYAKLLLEEALERHRKFRISVGGLAEMITAYPELTINADTLFNVGVSKIKSIQDIKSTSVSETRAYTQILEQIIEKYPHYEKTPEVHFFLAKAYLCERKVLKAKQVLKEFKEKRLHSKYIDDVQELLDFIPELNVYEYIGDFGSRLFSGKGEFGTLDPYYPPEWWTVNPIIDITVDNQGSVFLADRWNKRISKFDASGNFLWTTKQKILPLDIEADEYGNLYVMDGKVADRVSKLPDAVCKILKLSSEGEIIAACTRFDLTNPRVGVGIVVSENELWTIEGWYRYGIEKFNEDLRIVERFEYKGTPSYFRSFFKLCEGEHRDVLYILEGRKLKKVETNGNVLWTRDFILEDIDIYESRATIKLDKQEGIVCVLFQSSSYKTDSKLVKVDTLGNVLSIESYPLKPYRYLISNPEGEFFTAKFDSSYVFIYDRNDSLITFVNGSSSTKGQFLTPSYIQVDENDRVLVYDKILKKKILYDEKGNFIKETTLDFKIDIPPSSYPDIKFGGLKKNTKPEGCAKGRDGKLYFLFSWATPQISKTPTGLNINYHGIQVYDQKKNFLKEIILPCTEIFGYIDIEVTDDGLIYVAHNAGRIIIYNYDGEKIDEFGRGVFSAEPVDCYSGLSQIAIDSQKRVYAVDGIDASVKKFVLVR